jgi:telomerase reverse transcriptase
MIWLSDIRAKSTIPISWSYVLYGRPIYSDSGRIIAALPPSHCLQSGNSIELMKQIFPWEYSKTHQALSPNHNMKVSLSESLIEKRTRRLEKITLVIEKLIFSFRKCNLAALLDHYCPIDLGKLSNHIPIFEDLNNPAGSIIGFCRSVIRRTFPKELLGSDMNIKQFILNLDSFFRIKRYDSLSVGMISNNIKLSEIDWLQISSHAPPSDSIKKQHLFNEFCYWVISGFFVPLLKSNFYITETTVHKHLLHFYRHKVWTKVNMPYYKLITESIYTELNPNQVEEFMEESFFGFSTMRLLPKKEGARPIVNLKRRCIIRGKSKISVNQELKSAHGALLFELKKDPRIKGIAVSGKPEIYQEIKAFKMKLMERYPNGLPRLYFCSLDIKACFDSIDQKKLLNIVESVITEMHYTISKYATIHVVMERIRKRFHTTARNRGTFNEFATSLAQDLFNAIIVDNIGHHVKERVELLRQIELHISSHIVRVGKKFFKQTIGIPQGSILSSVLCDIYFGNFESSSLLHWDDQESLMLRYVDDFLFISTKASNAAEFVKTVYHGKDTHGFLVNISKSIVNFDLEMEGLLCKHIDPSKGFPWYGLLIMMDLGLAIDYTRLNGTLLKNSITHDKAKTPGYNLYTKTMYCIRTRTHLLFFDPILNTKEQIRQNISQSFVHCAKKLVVQVKELFREEQSLNLDFLQDIITGAINYQHYLIQRRLNDIGKNQVITKDMVHYLGYSAFLNVLQAHQPKYAIIVLFISNLLMAKRFAKF